jgi:hypothetical protein
MSKMEIMLREIARLYKGITVAEYERMFAGMTANELEFYLHQEKRIAEVRGEEV